MHVRSQTTPTTATPTPTPECIRKTYVLRCDRRLHTSRRGESTDFSQDYIDLLRFRSLSLCRYFLALFRIGLRLCTVGVVRSLGQPTDRSAYKLRSVGCCGLSRVFLSVLPVDVPENAWHCNGCQMFLTSYEYFIDSIWPAGGHFRTPESYRICRFTQHYYCTPAVCDAEKKVRRLTSTRAMQEGTCSKQLSGVNDHCCHCWDDGVPSLA